MPYDQRQDNIYNYNNEAFNNRNKYNKNYNIITNENNEYRPVRNNYQNNINYNSNENKDNYISSKGNRYKFMFIDEDENPHIKNYNGNNQYNNDYQENNYHNRNNYQNENSNKNYNRVINNLNYNKRDNGPRYNLYDFRYDQSPNNQRNNSDQVKIIFQKVNYDNYCEKNNFDKNRNYHFYRENGYYNYNQAMKNYQNNIRENHRYY